MLHILPGVQQPSILNLFIIYGRYVDEFLAMYQTTSDRTTLQRTSHRFCRLPLSQS
jgi:hypothetical protein